MKNSFVFGAKDLKNLSNGELEIERRRSKAGLIICYISFFFMLIAGVLNIFFNSEMTPFLAVSFVFVPMAEEYRELLKKIKTEMTNRNDSLLS